MPLHYLKRRKRSEAREDRWIEPRLGPEPGAFRSEVFDSGRKTIIDCAHVRVERLGTQPVLFSKVFKEFEDRSGHKYDYRYWAERENFFLREFLKRQNEFTHVVQARHLISENEAAKQVLTRDAGITIANWLRVKARYADTATLSHPFQRSDAFLRMLRACLTALRQIHAHRIVHCDIKEDNICIPYAPYPFAGAGQPIGLEYENLKLIDFAFAVAHSIPLTQILVIDPDERLPYQSELLISALQADRRSGCPNAVQQLDYRVDLFSLGRMAEKIAAAGLDRPAADAGVSDGIHHFIETLKAFDATPPDTTLPHDALIEEIDRLLAATARRSESVEFRVDGEWTSEELAQGRGASRHTPLTPVASPVRTPIAAPMLPVFQRPRARNSARVPFILGLIVTCAAAAFLMIADSAEDWLVSSSSSLAVEKKEAAPSPPQTAVTPAGAAPAPAPALPPADPARIAAEYGETLASSASREARSRALAELISMAKGGNEPAAQRLAAFEKNYDAAKQTLAKSPWWVRGAGSPPPQAARWMEDGELLAEHGDRPAMLDVAFALGHGRAPRKDRAMSVETYLRAMANSTSADAFSQKIRQSAARGLTIVLNSIVEHKDADAANRVLPALQANADLGAAGMKYYLGLFSECVRRPADLAAAREWYRKAAADPTWKAIAERKAQLLGKWCPRPVRA